MNLEILSSTTEDEFRSKLLICLETYNIDLSKKTIDLEKLNRENFDRPRISIVVDGPTLAFALSDVDSSNALF